MDQKKVIRRIPKYRIQGYLNQDQEVVIQARLDAQIREWMMQDKEIIQEPLHETENVVCHFIDPNKYALLNIEDYRSQRTRSQLLNTYLIEELAFAMLIIDFIWVLVLQLYLNWSSPYTFERIYPKLLLITLAIHLMYCISIYLIERHKERQLYTET